METTLDTFDALSLEMEIATAAKNTLAKWEWLDDMDELDRVPPSIP